MRIEVLVFPGVDELDFVGPLSVFRRAAEAGADMQTRVVSLGGATHVQSSCGLRFQTDGGLGSNGRADLLVVPGGGWIKRAAQGSWIEAQRGVIPAAIAEAYRGGTILAAVCTGAMLIATAGLLKSRHAITHQGSIDELRQAGAEIVPARIVDDGDIISCGGVTSGIDLSLHIVERFVDRRRADQIANTLEYERRGPIHVTGISGQHGPTSTLR